MTSKSSVSLDSEGLDGRCIISLSAVDFQTNVPEVIKMVKDQKTKCEYLLMMHKACAPTFWSSEILF